MMPLLIGKVSRRDAEHRSRDTLQELGLEHRFDHKPAEMSGGEQQRVAVARAIVNRPQLILADEPSGNLDEAAGGKLTDLLWRLSRDLGHGFIIVTHNPQLAEKADRQIHMKDGRIQI